VVRSRPPGRIIVKARALKSGQAISELIRRGIGERPAMRNVAGAWVLDLPAGTPTATERQARNLLDRSPLTQRNPIPRSTS
jgi:hypothetical protein